MFSRSWILKTPIGNDIPELGLGPYPEVTLSVARQKARELKEQIRQGIDPRVTRKGARLGSGRRTGMALRFAILTAARSSEIRAAMWSEIDFKAKVWTIPGERMKGGRDHKVPLSRDAVDLLKSLSRDHDSEVIFLSPTGKMLSNMTLTKVLKDMGHQVTQHGFRATFRTWAQEQTSYPEEVCELALAHVNSDATRAAYARSELIDKHRKLMADWERFAAKDCHPRVRRIRIRSGRASDILCRVAGAR